MNMAWAAAAYLAGDGPALGQQRVLHKLLRDCGPASLSANQQRHDNLFFCLLSIFFDLFWVDFILQMSLHSASNDHTGLEL